MPEEHMPSIHLQASNLQKRYGSLKALDDVSFHVGVGEVVGVVGPNGAGKTTLFGALAGTFPTSSGEIELNGENITSATAEERCTMVFENVLVAARAGGGLSDVESVTHTGELLEKTGLMPLANSAAGAIGLLDRKRLEVARSLATSPEVILLDEIGGGLTEAELLILVELINDLKASGMTIVWIEHILHALLKVIDRLVCMAEGRVLAEGDPQEVMANAEVRSAYLGSEPA